jgi:hypothetical protein
MVCGSCLISWAADNKKRLPFGEAHHTKTANKKPNYRRLFPNINLSRLTAVTTGINIKEKMRIDSSFNMPFILAGLRFCVKPIKI